MVFKLSIVTKDMYLGPFYLNTKELFLLFGALFLGVALYFNWNTMWFSKTSLLILTILFLITKGLLPAIHNEAFFINALVTLVVSLYFPIYITVLFFFISFGIMKILKVI